MKTGVKNYNSIKNQNSDAVDKEELLSYFSKLKGNQEYSQIISIRFEYIRNILLIYVK